MIGVSIKYGDYAPEAKENFTYTASEKADFIDMNQLKEYDLDVPNYANICEYGAVLLDGSAVPFPENPQDKTLGYWSNSITSEDYTFSTPIVFTLTEELQYSSKGFTFTFDVDNNIFCNDLNIKWYRDSTLLFDVDYTPDTPFYFCSQAVENFNKVIITFNSLNMPYNRLKIRSIDFGYGTIFTGAELSNVKVIQEIDTLSEQVSINVVDFNLKSKNDFEYSFQKMQPLSVYFNDNLIQTCFVEKSTRKSKREWEINSFDYIGLLDKVTFVGDLYNSATNAKTLLETIFEKTSVPYEIDSAFDDSTVKGNIPICTCREAIRQICFAIGAIVDTSYSNKVIIKPLSQDTATEISLDRIMQGQKITDDSVVTKVSLTYHSYVLKSETTELYKAQESGTGNNIFVSFSSPCANLSITDGEIVTSNANYAIINATSTNCILSGNEYEVVKTIKEKSNPLVLAGEQENIKEFNGFTLVTADNVDNILELCYNEAIKTSKMSLKIIEGKRRIRYGEAKYNEFLYGQWIYDSSHKVGENISAQTDYSGNVVGMIISQRYNLNGGIIIKECDVKL